MTIKDIDISIQALNNAIKSHYAWAAQLLCLTLPDASIDASLIAPSSHQHCRFSEWLRTSRHKVHFSDRQLISVIDINHRIMHDAARELMNAIIAKNASQQVVNDYVLAQNNFILSLDKYKEQLFALRNMHDALTGLPLRQLLYKNFDLFRRHMQQRGHRMYVLMIDIDRFKNINDSWGHNAGDEVLQAVTRILKAAGRSPHHIYRFGGEEFVMLLEATCEQDAREQGDALCQYLARHPINIDGGQLRVTMTGGLTRVQLDESLHDVIGRADKALYHGKSSGRNRCIYAGINGDVPRMSRLLSA
ncbi:diguanylate cyclase [Shimwellia pseudoproteus]|uniref:diguanylate cyclase n=1 Tax=Shimwellia pseudoproteus TaxID=570012 RepID=UPI001E62CD9E|nr:diguanylate cyclase [Shimwellia pseudoproteus]